MTEEITTKMKEDFDNGMTSQEVSKKYGYSERTVYRVKNGYITPEDRRGK